MLTTNERFAKIATANQKTLARIDQVLTGEDTTTAGFVNQDTRTCTLTDAARRLGVSRPSVYRLIQSGRLDVLTMNGVNRVTVKSINDFSDGNRPPSASTVERMAAKAERNRATAREAARKRANANK